MPRIGTNVWRGLHNPQYIRRSHLKDYTATQLGETYWEGGATNCPLQNTTRLRPFIFVVCETHEIWGEPHQVWSTYKNTALPDPRLATSWKACLYTNDKERLSLSRLFCKNVEWFFRMVADTFTQLIWKPVEIIFWVYIPLIINNIVINIISRKSVGEFSPICMSEQYGLCGGYGGFCKYKFMVIINVGKCNNYFVTDPAKSIHTGLYILKFILCKFSAVGKWYK